MPLAHGMYSVGVLVGAVGAGLARSDGGGRESILVAVSICVAAVGALAATEDAAYPFGRALVHASREGCC